MTCESAQTNYQSDIYNSMADNIHGECTMSAIKGFPPIIANNSRILILGSMPSQASLLKQQYYGHPRNGFWPIMNALFGIAPALCYQVRKEMLMSNGIAVWDVVQSCYRAGSSDSGINQASIQANDFSRLFVDYQDISKVYFNGRMAEKLFLKRIFPLLNLHFSYLEYVCLPSTSPANATLNLEQKIEAWRVIKQHVVK
jgi:double-stranded uracil-DNA glycosylase